MLTQPCHRALETGLTNWPEEIEDAACGAITEAVAGGIPGGSEAMEALEMAMELAGLLAPDGAELPDTGIPCL